MHDASQRIGLGAVFDLIAVGYVHSHASGLQRSAIEAGSSESRVLSTTHAVLDNERIASFTPDLFDRP